MFDEVWVPCKVNYNSMARAGWRRSRLKYIPEGVDSDFYSPGAGVYPHLKKDSFTFLFVGDWSYRKGVQWLIPCFAQAFKDTDNVRLLISSHYQGGEDSRSRSRIKAEFSELLDRHKITKCAPIEFIYDWIPDSELPLLYNSVDCVILLSCGEAWALPLIQGMACGKPVITTGWGGQMDFVNDKNAFPVKVAKFDTIHDKVNLSVDFYWYQDFAFPDTEDVIRVLRYVFNNPGEAARRGAIAREHVRRNFSWSKGVALADRRLKKLCGVLT